MTRPFSRALVLASALATLCLTPHVAAAQDWLTTQEELLDRIQIEDLLLHYYAGLGSDEGEKFSDYFTEDGFLDVNGHTATGLEQVQALYDNYSTFSPGEALPGKLHVLLNNPRIEVNGDTATAHLIWTEINSDSIKLAPRIVEQGTEYTELRKVDGRWLIAKRIISNSGGLPDAYDDLYERKGQ